MSLKLTEFKNKHKDEDIYILASGKSLDFIDNSFFANKIVIGINQAYKKIIPQYLIRKEHKLLTELLKDEKLKNITHFVSAGDCGSLNLKNLKYINSLDEKLKKNVCVYGHNKNVHDNIEIPKLTDNELYVSFSTITTGIYLAYYMGAKNIVLMGHDCGVINNESNFTGYHTNETLTVAWKSANPQQQYNNWLNVIENQTIKLKKYLNEKGINVLSINPFINFNLEGNKYVNKINKIN
jgi:hypothetical protein